jgi:uncharacterized protein (DUF302 family)
MYYNSKLIKGTKIAAIRPKVEDELKKEGFGVLNETDIQATMKKKLDKDYLPPLILGACSPIYAQTVISIEPSINRILHCNVTLRELESGDVEIAIIDPYAAIGSGGNPNLTHPAKEVQEKLICFLKSV